MAGTFITFEGIDGSGKTTHAELLAEALRNDGRDVVLTQEPGGTPLGGRIRSVVLSGGDSVSERAELLLFAADRAHHVDTLIRPALASGHVVISDRFADSTRAYQGFGRGIDSELIETVLAVATGGLVPDLTILVDVDEITSRERRKGEDRLEAGSDGFFERVRQGFLTLMGNEPGRIVRFDGREPKQEVAAAIYEEVRRRLM